MKDVHEFIRGFADVHIHAGPSLMDREVDAWEMAQEAVRHHLSAIVIKDHHLPSVGAARIVQKHLAGTKLRVFGGLALNSPVGGLNPKAVEVAVGFGAKIIWMPTVSCKNHLEKHSGHGVKFPAVKQQLSPEVPIFLLDPAGRLIPEAEKVLEVMARYPDLVLATGHGNREEVDAVVRRGAQMGLKRILVNHPHYMVDATLEDMKAWQALGAYIEFQAVTSVPSSQFYSVPPSTIAGFIKSLGPRNVVISSDYGQRGNGSPVEGVAAFIELLYREGISEPLLRTMVLENPAALLGL